MARMRRGLVHALAWSLATGAAVTLSWWGVHTVMSGTVYDPPRALPLPAGGAGVPESPGTGGSDPLSSSTRRPESVEPTAAVTRKPTPSGDRSTPATPSAAPSRTARPTTQAPPATTPPADSDVKTYTVDGGRVTFDLGENSAELVSAIPASGWQMQVWKQTTWIRVTFTANGRELSVFCVWHDTAPRVEIDDRAV
ncbi:hypothetical protein [Streptomyces sp. NBC_00691]|uniref:hypothetical protein n=1 Tax=Streptomyces sp. NBC_00691 TaxID=2903671 RepID=UPI002E3352E6|nr:hypothetical protein [Streptomyces sp. NBC_00691]